MFFDVLSIFKTYHDVMKFVFKKNSIYKYILMKKNHENYLKIIFMDNMLQLFAKDDSIILIYS